MGNTINFIDTQYLFTLKDLEISYIFYLDNEYGGEKRIETVCIPLSELAEHLAPHMRQQLKGYE